MANPLRVSVRRFATNALRAATTNAEAVNSYGIRVSKAQGVVDHLTGGKKLSTCCDAYSMILDERRWSTVRTPCPSSKRSTDVLVVAP